CAKGYNSAWYALQVAYNRFDVW
nr:immunoglobulin heavy chain junction region [Macaca mulatta]MOW99148.1 immunoglobulin heavy chain junction region [Macaca mulatta]MOX00203.1 immunoglobulin heavy chain junction region [Macaca mulatta]MOX01008.1 immunoglobulin heavy chain junction region [Macaca mulatta]MOX01563.1 immunoglobulin heavy chain junction region [Macaca mulatta]